MRTEPSLILPLFRSANQERLLSAVFLGSESKTIQSLSEQIKIPYATLHKEVVRLLEAGLLSEKKVGKSRVISANRESPFFKALHELLMISSGPVPKLREAMQGIEGIEKVFIFGSWAQRSAAQRGPTPADIDVMVIGEPDIRKVYKACSLVGNELGWQVNPTIMSDEEWRTETPFLMNVRKGGVIRVIGDFDMSVPA